jgi:hypothetical protein
MATDLSGKDWWHANQARFPNSIEIDALEPDFKSRVEDFIASLRQAGASVRIGSTRRNADRAYLMHYSWTIAHGEDEPKDVPARGGVGIVWDHGDISKSRAAALEMVQLFHLAYKPSLTSNHIKGKAIDMDISWSNDLVLTKPAPLLANISTRPRSGQNRELQDIAATTFRVYKLRSDPPHWSYNGR